MRYWGDKVYKELNGDIEIEKIHKDNEKLMKATVFYVNRFRHEYLEYNNRRIWNEDNSTPAIAFLRHHEKKDGFYALGIIHRNQLYVIKDRKESAIDGAKKLGLEFEKISEYTISLKE